MADNQNNTQEYVDMLRKELSLLDADEYIKTNGAERASMKEFLKKIEPLNYNDYHILLKAYLSSSSDKDIAEAEFDKYVDITKHCADPKDVES